MKPSTVLKIGSVAVVCTTPIPPLALGIAVVVLALAFLCWVLK